MIFADALEPGVEHFVLQANFARRDHERSFGWIALHGPAAIPLRVRLERSQRFVDDCR